MTNSSTPAANRFRFRAWHPRKKRMYEVRSLHNLHSGVNVHADLCRQPDESESKAIFSTHYSVDSYQDEVIFMQPTGLTDKNGKEIFELDIVRTEIGQIGTIKYGKFMSSHEAGCSRYHWHIGFYVERNGEQLWGSCDEDLDLDKLEIIGNLYENPELLS